MSTPTSAAAKNDAIQAVETIERWMDRYEWSGELAAIGGFHGQAVNEERILTALRAMWDDWRDEVFPAIQAAIRSRA